MQKNPLDSTSGIRFTIVSQQISTPPLSRRRTLRDTLTSCIAILSLGISEASFGQANLVEYDLAGQPGNQTSTDAVSPSPSNITSVALTRGLGLTASSATNSFSSSGWTGETTDYYEFGFDVGSGFQVAGDKIYVTTRSSNTGPGTIGIFHSGDGFAAPLTTITQTGTANTNTEADISSLSAMTGSVRFRLQAIGTNSANGGVTASGGTFRVANFGGTPASTFRVTGTLTTGGADTTPPVLASSNPADNAIDVPVNSTLELTFNEDVQPIASGVVTLHLASDNSVVETFTLPSAAVTVSEDTVTIVPTNPFASTTEYYVLVSATAFEDLAGNAFVGISSPTDLSFTSGSPDVTAPTLVSTDPVNSAIDVAFTQNIALTFSETVQGITNGTLTLRLVSDDSVVETFTLPSAGVSIVDDVVTINPTADFDASTSYYVEVAPNALEDLAGNDFAGFTGASTLAFTTAAGLTGPANLIAYWNHNSNALAGGGFGYLPTDFPQAADLGAGTMDLADLGDTTTATSGAYTSVASFGGDLLNAVAGDVAGGSISPTGGTGNANNGMSIVFQLNTTGWQDIQVSWAQRGTGSGFTSRAFEYSLDGTTYTTVDTDTGALTSTFALETYDLSAISAIDDQAVVYFRIVLDGATGSTGNNRFDNILFTGSPAGPDVTPPLLASSVPADDAIDVPVNSSIELTFNEQVQEIASGVITLHLASDNSVVETFTLPSAAVTTSGTLATIIPTNPFASSTEYYVLVSATTFEDTAGNDFAGITSPTELSFTTGAPDATAPTLASSIPSNGATGVSVNTTIDLTFDEAIQLINGGSITLRLASDNSAVETFTLPTTAVTPSGSTVTIVPSSPLTEATSYYLEVATATIEDLAGNDFAGFTGASTLAFTTEVGAIPGDVIAAWQVNGLPGGSGNYGPSPFTPSSVDANVTVGGLSRAVGVTTANSGAGNAWGGNGWDDGSDLASAVTAENFVTFSITPNAGFNASLSGIDVYNIRRSGSGPTTGQWQYSTDGIAFTDIGSPITWGTVTSGSGNPQTAINLSGIPALQSIAPGVTVTFRLVNWGATTSGGTWYVNTVNSTGTEEDLVIKGTTSAAGPDLTPPTLVSSNPANGATDVSIGSNVVLTFSEAVQAISSGSITLRLSSDTSVVESFTLPSAAVNFAGSTVTIDPTSNFAESTDYYVEIAAASIQDPAGNPFPGFTGAGTLSFTTAAPDTTAPLLASTNPVNGATGVNNTGFISLTFDEPVQEIETGTVTIRRADDNSEIFSTTLVDDTFNDINTVGDTVTINLEFLSVPSATEVYVEVSPAAFADLAGNEFVGFTGPSTWSFTTIDPNAAPLIAVNKYSNGGVGGIDIVELLVIGDETPGSTVDMRGMILKDFASNMSSDGGGKLAFSTDSLWQAVPVGTLIVLAKDTAVNATTDIDPAGDFTLRIGLDDTTYFANLGDTFDISDTDMVMIKAAGSPATGVEGAIHALAGGTAGSFFDDFVGPKLLASAGGVGVFANNSTSSAADFNGTDATGAATIASNNFGFGNTSGNITYIDTLRGGSTDTTPPTLVSTTPANNATEVNASSDIRLTFDEPVVVGSTGTIALKNAAGDALIETFDLSLAPAGVTASGFDIVINPSADLPYGATVYVELDAGAVTDAAGNPATGFTGSGTLSFTTADPTAQPTVVVNKYLNGGTGGVDTVELLVIGSGIVGETLDMRGMILKDFSSSITNDSGGKFRFAEDADAVVGSVLWSAVPVGTLIVITNDSTGADLVVNPASGDFTLRVGLLNPDHFIKEGTGTFDIATVDMVMIKAAGSDPLGVTGGIHAFAGGTLNPTAPTQPSGAQFVAFGGPKLLADGIATSAGTGVYAVNTNGLFSDFNGSDAAGDLANNLSFASPNPNATGNATYIASLRGLSGGDGDGLATLSNQLSGAFFDTKVFDDGLSGTQNLRLALAALLPSATLESVRVTVPAEFGTPLVGNIAITGAGAGTPVVTIVGQEISISGLAVTSTDAINIDLAGLDTPTPGIGSLGNYPFLIATASPGGSLTPISSSPTAYVIVPLTNVRGNDVNGVAINRNAIVATEGVNTEENFLTGSNTGAYLQTATAGINVFHGGIVVPYTRGNRYVVLGVIGQFNGQTQLSPSSASDVFDLGPDTEPAPILLTIDQLLADPELYESLLIQIQDLEPVDPLTAAWTLGANIPVTDGGTGTLILRLNAGSQALSEPSYPATITGIFTQFDSSSPFDSGYQIAPRDDNDTGGVAPLDYASWIDSFFPGETDPAIVGFNADPDNDGIPNGLEGYFGTAPDSANSAPISGVSKVGNVFTFRHRQAKSANQLSNLFFDAYQWTTNLGGWNASGDTVGGVTVQFSIPLTVDTSDPNFDVVENTATITGGTASELFVRLVIGQF